VSWLGVTQYLTGEAIGTTLDVIGGFAGGTELLIEYLVPGEMRDASGQALADFYMPRAAASGEPWLTFFTPTGIRELLAARGLVVTEDVGRREQIDPSLWERSDGLAPMNWDGSLSRFWRTSTCAGRWRHRCRHEMVDAARFC
jgi:O-methyltransferase involved in polyketide biosynthesis